MQLTHRFEVPQPPDVTWQALLDLERVASCMPGARLDGTDGDDHLGSVRIKLGPVSVGYRGRARFTSVDDAERRAVLVAEGRDMRGQGTARAHVTATVIPHDGAAQVSVETELELTGKVAQFGRGAIEEVSSRLLADFAQRLQASLAQGEVPTTGQDGATPGVSTTSAMTETPAALDALALVPPQARRAATVGAVAALALVLLRLLRRPARTVHHVVAVCPQDPVDRHR